MASGQRQGPGGTDPKPSGATEPITLTDPDGAVTRVAPWSTWTREQVRAPGGETGHDFYGRFDDSISEVEASGVGTAVVVSHGAAIRVWVAGRAVNVPPSFAGKNDIQNTGVIELDGSNSTGWTLLSWQGTPVGGSDLIDVDAHDPTGETMDEALEALAAQGVTVIAASEAEATKWQDVGTAAIEKLRADQTVSGAVLDAALAARAEWRAQHP